jgi:aerobic-type carbon monoxide dehydrogenase small subunit (CoxS/CutS family)
MSSITINGRPAPLPDDGDAFLVDVIRDDLGLTGTKLVCGSGVCGACTVLLDGVPVASCLMPAQAAAGRTVTTVEGIGETDLHPVQKAFMAHDGLQCGFCTPGQIMSAVGLIQEGQAGADPERVRESMSGNLCRCGAYQGITEAVLQAQKTLDAASRKEVA